MGKFSKFRETSSSSLERSKNSLEDTEDLTEELDRINEMLDSIVLDDDGPEQTPDEKAQQILNERLKKAKAIKESREAHYGIDQEAARLDEKKEYDIPTSEPSNVEERADEIRRKLRASMGLPIDDDDMGGPKL